MQSGLGYIFIMTIEFTSNAAKQVGKVKPSPDHFFRLAVKGGGCSGFSYDMSFDNQLNDDDEVIETDGEKLVVDAVSLELLNGSTVDFVNELIGSHFQIANPNAKSGCGCGESFAI